MWDYESQSVSVADITIDVQLQPANELEGVDLTTPLVGILVIGVLDLMIHLQTIELTLLKAMKKELFLLSILLLPM
jgi:hypothetical protein